MKHRIVALISGGKDSTFSILKCVEMGHDVVALAHLFPPENKEEIDSYMYQTVGNKAVKEVAHAIGVPFFHGLITGCAVTKGLQYSKTESDEVENLYELLNLIKIETNCTAVCSGAIYSTYQKNRVENVCERLGLESIAPLWQRNQVELLQEMLDHKMNIRIIKVASIGLDESHVGCCAADLINHFKNINKQYGFNVCGEGGEYESLVTDCPLFSHQLFVENSEKVMHSYDDMAPVWYEKITKIRMIEKPGVSQLSLKQRLAQSE